MSTDEIFDRLSHLIKKGDVVGVRAIVASGVDPDLRRPSGWTPLMIAADAGHTPIVQLLLSAGAEVDAVDRFGVSALALAALEGRCHTIQVLLDAGASVAVRPHGACLLEYAYHGGGRSRTHRHFDLLRAAGATWDPETFDRPASISTAPGRRSSVDGAELDLPRSRTMSLSSLRPPLLVLLPEGADRALRERHSRSSSACSRRTTSGSAPSSRRSGRSSACPCSSTAAARSSRRASSSSTSALHHPGPGAARSRRIRAPRSTCA